MVSKLEYSRSPCHASLVPPSFGTAGKPPTDQNAQYNCSHAANLQVSDSEKRKENSWVLLCPASEGSFTGSDGHHPTYKVQPPATTPNPTDRPSISANRERQ